MEAFLTSCCRAVKENQGGGPGFHVVLGNEACDLDSMVCALTYAYFLSKSSGEDQQVVPLLNIKRVEFPLRSDSIFLLQQLHLSADLLLFRDQLDLQDLNRAGRLRLTLVDHNVLPSLDSDLEGAVVQVIDHHLLERRPSPSCHVTVEMVGSCATLVTERILQEAPQILDLQVAHMIYGKVTPQDSAVAAELQVRFPDLPQREDLFQRLQDAKFSVSGNTLASRKKLLPLVKDFLSERERVGFHGDAEEESRFPPTPMNSLVDGCPLDGGGPPTLSAQDLQDQFSRMADSDL
ncbi:exopolyphosphatase PRUNE1 isoform X2 [Eleginops maclovinus]|uniref:exopolyphosphatase PRUNE1 isoform X2 n=1 Tax=Eleginops maclovinus TaxID=56733 RepID=UPI003080CD6C